MWFCLIISKEIGLEIYGYKEVDVVNFLNEFGNGFILERLDKSLVKLIVWLEFCKK